MTTIKNVFNNYINQDDIYDYVINAKRPRMSLKPAISVCMILLVCLVGQSFMQEKSSNVLRDETNKIIINSLSDDYVVNEDYLIVQASPSISDEKSFYDENSFIKELEKEYDWKVYYARFPNADDFKDYGNQNLNPLYMVFQFANNEKEIEIKVTDQDMLFKQYDSYDPSIINNKSVIIYKNEEYYFAVYETDDSYYEVKSTNLNENEFLDALQVIIEK